MLTLYSGDILNVFDGTGSNTDVEVWSEALGPLYAAQAPSTAGSGVVTAQAVWGLAQVGLRAYNSGGSAVTVTVSRTLASRTVTGGGITGSATYVVVKATLQTLETLVIDDTGIYSLDKNGGRKQSTTTSLVAATAITSTSSTALAVGPSGTTNPALQIDASTSSAATGLKITAAAAASGLALAVISSGTNENLTVDAKGSGTVTLAATSTGNVRVQTKLIVTTTGSDGFCVGAGGTSNAAFQVDASTASQATGWQVTGLAAAGGAGLRVISSGTNEAGTIDAKGSGTLTLQGTATGAITLSRATGVTGALTVTSAAAASLTVGANGATNPVFALDASTSSVATGLKITGAAAAASVALVVTSSGTDENLTINAKGSGTISLNATATGTVTIGSSLTFVDAKNIVFNTTTGTKIGTTTTQKIGFYNATPVVQQAASSDTTTAAAGSTTNVFLNTTFTGGVGSTAYTLGGILAGLKNLGLFAQ